MRSISPVVGFLLILAAAIALDYFVVVWLSRRWYQKRQQQGAPGAVTRLMGAPSPVITWLRQKGLKGNFMDRLEDTSINPVLPPAASEKINRWSGRLQNPLGSAWQWLARQWLGFRKAGWKPLVEASLVVLWAFWIGRGYLNFSTTLWPAGMRSPWGWNPSSRGRCCPSAEFACCGMAP